MVNSEFEKIMLSEVTSIGKTVATLDERSHALINDISELKKNVSSLCDRTTNLETDRDAKIKSHSTYLKILGGISGILSTVVTIKTFFTAH